MSEAEHAGTRGGWLRGIEALRGIAAAVVVVHHCYTLSDRPPMRFAWALEGLGTYGVDLFYLLSGYLLADYFWSRGYSGRSLRDFWVRRSFRIAPAYYVNVALLFLFFADHSLLFSKLGLRQLLANVTFTHYLWPDTSSSLNVNGALWTLTIEAVLYVMLPILAWCVARFEALGFVFLVAASLAYRSYIALDGRWLTEALFRDGAVPVSIERLYLSRQFLGSLVLFALGIGLKRLVSTGTLDRWNVRALGRLSFGTLVALLAPALAWLYFVGRATDYREAPWFVLWELGLGLLMLPALLYASRPTADGSSPALRAAIWLGERSYGLYLWHFPIILSVYGRGAFLRGPELTKPALQLGLVCVLSLIAADLSYRLIELPAQHRARSLTART